MKKVLFFNGLVLLLVTGLLSCTQKQTDLKVNFEKYTLDNGLEVILHEDRSDPIAAVAVLYHVGSNREEVGKTGFAHLFEHIMFQESQHVGQDQFFKKIQEAGGTLNGGTSNDFTIYFEIIPNNALELALWLEADRLGFLLSTVTQEAFMNQQDVVKNEKRQRVDNQPYGHTSYVINKNIYPEGHPYNWQVIGSMEDLTNATLDDVRDFYKKWYRPNNATLVVAGDFDVKQTKEWIEKYFAEIESAGQQPDPRPWVVTLDETKRVYHEDNFARSPELNMVFPTVQQGTNDAYALQFLGLLLADGKKTPLYKILVEEEKLAPSVSAFNSSQQVAGVFRVRIRAFPGKNLTDVEKAIHQAFQRFEEEGFSDKDLDRYKARMETQFYNGIASVFTKAYQLAYYNEFYGSPGYIHDDLQRTLAVSKEDVLRVYRKYIKDKLYVLTSFVPRGQTQLVAGNSILYPVVEEDLAAAPEVVKTEVAAREIEKIPTSFDRSIEPPRGPDPEIHLPTIWQDQLSNGIKIAGIVHDELPLVQFSLTLRGGMVLDDPQKIGVANLISDLMMQGTATKTPIELEDAINELGSTIRMYTTKESIVLQVNCLASKIDETYALVAEILLEPRWDEKEFNRLKDEIIERINRNKANPNVIASNVFNKLIYGSENILAYDINGNTQSVQAITLDDLKEYYNQNFSPSVTLISIVGAIGQNRAVAMFKSLEINWVQKQVTFPELKFPESPQKRQLYFVDMPDAKQSVIHIGYLGLPYTHEDFYPCYVMNYKLGGSFSGTLNLILREEKGYTYGARSGFNGTMYPGAFLASSSVQSAYTAESVTIFKEEMEKYRNGLTGEDLQFTQDALIKSNTLRFETLGALLGLLNNINTYDLAVDYIKEQERIVKEMTIDRHRELAQRYIDPQRMVYLIVGDARTQLPVLKKLGLDRVISLDSEGKSLN